ncbi:amidohydrolase family protein [Spirosoma panaciterrae]|uniref:amidohydrolase family protein n=1 Tax=Spirosoma panaciterrae TaxID=496058 RepID=UPI00035D599C|nr:amidohydrolase family protein [Spirosoma panaciterrae]
MNRRDFLALTTGASATVGLSSLGWGDARPIPIIDTHIHLFDTKRPQGVPWPTPKDEVLYQPALPDRYRKIAQPLGVVGAIVVEASPWVEDNQWVLDQAAQDTVIVGVVGNLEPGTPKFRQQLERFQRNPLFRGIRYGNLWNRDLAGQLANPSFIADLRVLAQAGLVLDTANPNPTLLAAIVQLTDRVPTLRVIIDHLPQMPVSSETAARKTTQAYLQTLSQRPQVYVKISEVLRRVEGTVPRELSYYRARLDELFGLFGEDRLLYGSDWPNSDQWLPFDVGLRLVQEYVMGKGRPVAEKYFWKNSVKAYQWVRRDATQPAYVR